MYKKVQLISQISRLICDLLHASHDVLGGVDNQ